MIKHESRTGREAEAYAAGRLAGYEDGLASSEGALRLRGWIDEYEAEANSAMDYGEGYRDGLARAALTLDALEQAALEALDHAREGRSGRAYESLRQGLRDLARNTDR